MNKIEGLSLKASVGFEAFFEGGELGLRGPLGKKARSLLREPQVGLRRVPFSGSPSCYLGKGVPALFDPSGAFAADDPAAVHKYREKPDPETTKTV